MEVPLRRSRIVRPSTLSAAATGPRRPEPLSDAHGLRFTLELTPVGAHDLNLQVVWIDTSWQPLMASPVAELARLVGVLQARGFDLPDRAVIARKNLRFASSEERDGYVHAVRHNLRVASERWNLTPWIRRWLGTQLAAHSPWRPASCP